MKNKKGYFNLEQSLITVGLVLIGLFIFFKIINPIPAITAEPYELTGSDVRGYITGLEKNNNDLISRMFELEDRIDYWSNIDQAEEIKELQKRPTYLLVIGLTGLFLIFYILFFVMMAKNDNRKREIETLEIKLQNIKDTLYSKNKKKVTMMKKMFEEKG